MRTATIWLAAGAVALSACDTTPAHVREQGRRHRLASVGVARFDSAGTYDLAGVSAYRSIDIDALRPERLGADTLDPAVHVYRARCGSCHEVPAPETKPAYLWEAMLSRMKKNAADAGLMPMSREDEAVVLRFLREHASDRR